MEPKENQDLIRKGLDLLRLGLKPFIQKEMSEVYGDSWETEGLNALGRPSYAKLNWDAYALLKLIDRKWNDVFHKKLEKRNRAWVHEALAARNDFAHQNSSFSDNDTLRDLDTIERLLVAVSAPESREVALRFRSVQDSGRRKYGMATPGGITFHSVRHWFSSKLEDLGVSKTVRRDLLGHEPRDITDDYTHSTIEMRRRAVSLLCQTSTEKVVAMASKSGTRVRVTNESGCKLLILW